MSYMFQGYLASGQVLENRGELEQAKQKYELAIKDEPHAIVGHIRLGDVCQKLGKNDLAEAAFKTALDIDPDHPDINYAHAFKRLASLHKEQSKNEPKKLGQAIEEYEVSAKLNPTDADSYYMIAMSMASLD